jgi:hypothetical protein
MFGSGPRGLVAGLVVFLSGSLGHAAVLHVPGDYSAIQSAIDNSANGDVILVNPGVYNESIIFKGKAITISSTNVADPGVVGSTVIHAAGRTSVVTFTNGETSNSILAGLTLTGGYGTLNDSFGTNLFWGAGIYCFTSSPSILGNIITANVAADGAASDLGYGSAIACIQSDAMIARNQIMGNSGYAGGGILTYLGKARIASNLIYSNSAVVGGGAVLISGSQFINNTLVGNAAPAGGGNIYGASDTSGQCLLTNNIICNAALGGGVYLDSQDGATQMAFNDVWNNTGGDYYEATSRTGINSNISEDPMFVDSANNDYHLQVLSPCINAGAPNFQASAGEVDFYRNSRVFGSRVDIGAAEYFGNFRPLADAGEDQMLSEQASTNLVTLDGSRSSDPEHAALSYHWQQIAGWNVQLSGPAAVKPTFTRPWPGTYPFQLVVNDGLVDSQPDVVKIVIGPNHAPVANAGPGRYVVAGSVTLDGTKSYDPDGVATLTYQWRQILGPAVTIAGTNTSTPVVTVTTKTSVQKCVFELIVSDGNLSSSPSNVTVTIVPNYFTSALVLNNPPFDSAKPTVLAFSGGNCSTGSGLTLGGIWEQQANWLTVNTYGPAYAKYGDMLMVYLSSVAPDYKKPIQTMGYSTGNLPAMEVARYVNATYADARYAVNRVSLLDPVCSNLSTSVAQYHANPVAGEQCWVDNYISNDPGHAIQPILPGAFNVICNPARAHSYPIQRYATSSLDYTNGGLTAFAYLSLIGDGKNFQLNTASQKYYFKIDSTESIVYFNQSVYPGKIMSPVTLAGPADGNTLATNGAVFSCETVTNATHYQLLSGSNFDRVMDFTTISDTTNPPTQTIATLPYDRTYWTVRAYDQFGSTIYADPRLIQRPGNNPPVANAGPDQLVYAGQAGKATVTLNGASSADPDGDVLSFAWAWTVTTNLYLTNGVSPALELPVGTHTIQLMVNDGHTNSSVDQLNITVLPPLLLSIVRSGTNSVISWTTNASGFQLQTRTNFDSSDIWENVPDNPTISNNQFILIEPLEPKRFYRLQGQ